MNIYVSINTNHGLGETTIDFAAIHEFTTNGFIEGIYDAHVEFCCLPAAVDSNALSVVIEALSDVADYGDTVIFYANICKAIYKFLKRCRGYSKTIDIEGLEDIPETISVSDEMTEEELTAKVFGILELEKMKTGRDVKKILADEQFPN